MTAGDGQEPALKVNEIIAKAKADIQSHLNLRSSVDLVGA